MSLTKQLQPEANIDEQGFAIKFDANEDGTVPTFYVGYMGATNRAYSLALERAVKINRRAGKLTSAEADEIFIPIFAKTILRNWENVLMSDVTGNINEAGYAPFCIPHAISIMKRLPILYKRLQDEAGELENFRIEQLEDEVKN